MGLSWETYMEWIKKGFIYKPDERIPWAHSHAYLPTPIVLGNIIRIYMAFWDKDKVGRIGYIDVDIDDPKRILDISPVPCLDIGSPGRFDDHGVSPTGITIEDDGIFYLLYMGWHLSQTVPYQLFTGIARSYDGEIFSAYNQAPYFDRTRDAPFARSGASFINDPFWTSWAILVEGIKWIWFPKYNRYWMDTRLVFEQMRHKNRCDIIIPKEPDEFGFGRPWILQDKRTYHLFFNTRKITNPTTYTQHYAYSEGNLDNGSMMFNRLISPLLELGKEGEFDSKSISHASVIKAKDKWLMFYCGNDFGGEGIGYAECKDPSILL